MEERISFQGAISSRQHNRPEHDYSEQSRATYKALFMIFTPWVLFSSFIMTSFSSLWAFYSVFHSTLAGLCVFCGLIAFSMDKKILSKFSLPSLFASFSLIAPLASQPYLSHELAKRGGEWGGDFYHIASLILGGQIYWLLLPVALSIVIFGPKRKLISAGYVILFLGMFNFAVFICLISIGPLIVDLVQDAKLLFFAMIYFQI